MSRNFEPPKRPLRKSLTIDVKNVSCIDDKICSLFLEEHADVIHMKKFITAIEQTGIRKTDPRLKAMIKNIHDVYIDSGCETGSPETMTVSPELFKRIITDNIMLIAKALRSHFRIPDFQSFTKQIEHIYWTLKVENSGKVADYIPQLASFDSSYWAVAICTVDGQRFSIGDFNVPYTFQSASKPIVYAAALQELGSEIVHKYVGQEPSGRMFNELLLDHNKKPHNPMINAGAIMTAAIVHTLVKPNLKFAEKFDLVQNYYKRLAGGEYIGFSNSTFLSERESADRNFALGYYMREHKCFPEKIKFHECMDFYFQNCAMECTAESMSVLAGSLANGGVCPITEERVLRSEVVRDVLSLMHSCGMYDYSGQFAFRVGLPAKSGVSGTMILVVPNVMGIALWSPGLDSVGNSVRGVKFAEELVKLFNFHRFDSINPQGSLSDPRKTKYEVLGQAVVSLLFSAAAGDVTALRRFHLSGFNVSLGDYDGRTALHLAAAEGHLNCVEFLINKCKMDPNIKDRWGHTALDDATRFSHTDVIAFLKKMTGSESTSRLHPRSLTDMSQLSLSARSLDQFSRSVAASSLDLSDGSWNNFFTDSAEEEDDVLTIENVKESLAHEDLTAGCK